MHVSYEYVKVFLSVPEGNNYGYLKNERNVELN